jgi:hypothetical protein
MLSGRVRQVRGARCPGELQCELLRDVLGLLEAVKETGMNDKLLWTWRFVVLILLLYIGDSLREIYRATPSLPYDFGRKFENLSRDVSKIRDKISPEPTSLAEPACAKGADGKELRWDGPGVLNGSCTLYQHQLDQQNTPKLK